MKVVGYVRVSLDCAVTDVMDRETQIRSLERWARDNGHRLVQVYTDEGLTASTGLETRLGLADALAALRDRSAEGIVVARLERLAPSVLLQEQLLLEMERIGGALFSAASGEEVEIASDARDATRVLIREVLRDVPRYQTAVRDLWVRQRARKFPPTGDRQHAALARIEQLAEQGYQERDIARALSQEGFPPKLSRVFDFIGLSRIIRRVRSEVANRSSRV